MEEIISIVLMSIFAVFVIIYDIITFLFYMIFVPRKTMALTRSIKVQRVKAGSGKYKTYASRGPPMNQENYYSHFENVFDIINSSINEHRYRQCLGTREILSVKESYLPDGTKMYKYTIGSYKWMTYNAVKDNALPLSRGLHSIGIMPKMSVALYLDTRPEWMLSVLACFYREIIVIILDTSMEYVGLGHALWETAPSALITSEELLPRVTKHIENVASIKAIIYVGQNEEVPNLSSLPEKISIYSYEEVFERGKNLIIEGSPPHPDDVALITFTRGTAGPSKPFAVTHRDLVTAMLSCQSRLYFTSRDVMISYLPAFNFIELVLALTITMVGGSIGFSSTLMNQDRNKNIIFGAHSDASILRPTVMFVYPQLLLKFNKSIDLKIEKLRIFSRCLVKFGMKYKKFWMGKGYRTPLIDRVIFSNSAMMIGGKMRIIICGGSYLPAQTQIYSSITLCAPVVQVYFQAQNAEIGFCQSPDDRQMGLIGKPMEGIYVRLQDISEDYCKMRTLVSELITGRTQFSQWSTSLPDQSEDYFKDGDIHWVHTGDVVRMLRDGSFEFIVYLLDYEIPAAIMLEDNIWTLESGLLTTTYELRRGLMYEKYKSQIAYMFEELTHNQRKVRTKEDILVFFAHQCSSTP
ncbi:long-chain-fatty-acid--CoA ligase 4-like isoform X2 [Ischnura elegans]|uniref:long-chain-fatty-acid--CoA ligase 4-like isoform X2 n=1 Tax=Ischnura elegans TaxID=197161 RepID=UPI001ED890E2|nr:long-chain-fatty-acid--CoA ligase 4-like isoform X2 [Ischnura elegans]